MRPGASPQQTTTGVGLRDLLDRLVALLGAADRPHVAALTRRLEEDRLRILVAGEAKRGKSTLLNALLGRDLLPVGVLPLTAVPTTLTYGPDDRVEVHYLDGHGERFDVAALADLVTEDRNPDNIRGIADVTVYIAHPLLGRGIDLVDTPGVGSIHEHNTALAQQALREMDVAVFVTSADPPVSASERAVLTDVRALAVRVMVVLAKADQLDVEERDVVRDFVSRVASDVLGDPITPYVLSARQAIRARDDRALRESGLPEFITALEEYAVSGRRQDLVASVAGHGRRLAASAADEARLTLRAAELSTVAAEDRQSTFTTRLEAVRRLAEESQALLDAAVRTATERITAAARTESPRATADVRRRLDEWADARPDAAAAELDRAGRQLMRDAVADAAMSWRAAQEVRVDEEVAALTERLQGRLQKQLDAVRAAAAAVFEVRMASPPVVAALDPSSRFARHGAELAGFSELLAAGVRTRLPGSLGRRRVVDHLRAEIPELTDRSFGRARADLQQRLQETGRVLRAELARRYDEAVARVQTAVCQGQELARRDAGDRDRLAANLHDRIEALDRLAAEFERVTG